MPESADPDLILRVRRKTLADGRSSLEFEAKARDPQLDLYFRSFDSEPFEEDPKAHFQELLSEIDQAPEGGLNDWLEGRGLQLFEELIPVELQRRLWALRRAVRTVQILSDETWIPWELLRLQDPDDPSASGPFLVEAFSLTRWLLKMPPLMHLPLRRIALVLPGDSGLPMSQAEGERLKELAGEAHEIIEIAATLHDVKAALESGSYGGWHFTGHGLAWNGAPHRWHISLEEGEVLSSPHLTGPVRRLGKGAPLIFLNACHTGRGASSLTGMGGLASAFLKAGAGAFVGSLWSLEDEQAYRFSEDFYKHLFSGMGIGESVRMARLALRERFPWSNNWLAYTVFAHPLARCAEAPKVKGRRKGEAEVRSNFFRIKDPSNESPKPPLRVFLCHASTDKPRVRELHKQLRERGIDPWLDEENLLPGQDWEYEIRGAVRRADVAIVCLSQNSVTRDGYIQAEIRQALDVADRKPEGATFIIPLRLEDCSVPERLARWQWVDLFDEHGFHKLLKSLAAQALSAGRKLPLVESKERFIPFRIFPPTLQTERINEKDGTVLLYVPGGEVTLGAKDVHVWSKPVHRVRLSPFWIGKFPVTNEQYARFLEENASHPQPAFWEDPHFNGPQHPVVGVSWDEAQAYCRWAGLELPSEAQWEAAARGTDQRPYPWGKEPPTPRHANFADTNGGTTPVGKHPAGQGPYGTFDQAGNVWEWCADPWLFNAYQLIADGQQDPVARGDKAVRSLRGGSWKNPAQDLRAAYRDRGAAKLHLNSQGFRCVWRPA